jgi:hypothetical protein
MEESNVRVNKLKGQRKSKKQEPVEESIEQEDVVEPQPEPESQPQPKKKPAKKPVVQEEEYDVENQLPDVVIHKRHKGAKPRKIIVITGDSDADSSDEEMPYRAKPKVEIKKRAPKPTPPPREPSPEPQPKKPVRPKKEVTNLVGGDPKNEPRDAGKGLPQSHVMKNPPQPKAFVVDSFIDSLLGLA